MIRDLLRSMVNKPKKPERKQCELIAPLKPRAMGAVRQGKSIVIDNAGRVRVAK